MTAPTIEMRDLVGDEPEEAQQWMRDFKKCMLVHTLTLTAARLPEAHARAFPLHVAPGSEAEIWWRGLSNADRASWPTILQQFDVQWPPVLARAVPVTEHIDAFYAHVFDSSQLDTRIPTGNGNATRNAHTVFAEKLKTLGTKTTLPHVALIRAASKQVPPAVEELMQQHSQLAWGAWCEELGKLDTAVIQTKQRMFDRLDALESRQNSPAPIYTQAYQQQRQQMQYREPQQQQTPQQWRTAVPGPPVTFDTPPPPRNATTVARVDQERREWAARWPDGRALASRQYPLTPGTAHAVAGCTRCGEPETPSHTRYSCVSAHPLPELEQKYRANVRMTASKLQLQRPAPMTPGALGTPRGYSTPQRGGGQWGAQRGLFAQRGGWSARGGGYPNTPGTPGTPSPLHQLEEEEEVDEDVELELDEGSAGNGEEAA